VKEKEVEKKDKEKKSNRGEKDENKKERSVKRKKMRMRASRQNVGAFRSERLDRMAEKAETRVEATIAMAVSNRGSPFYSSYSFSAFWLRSVALLRSLFSSFECKLQTRRSDKHGKPTSAVHNRGKYH
jgi:hypothetical protein